MKPDKIFLSLILLVVVTVFSWISSCTHVADIANLPEVCFTGDVLPIFINNCSMAGCHDGRGETDMTLNNYDEIRQGVVPGNPDGSRIYQTLIDKWGNMMPPSQPLSLENRTKIRVWIEQGAALTTCPDQTGGGGGGGGGGTYVARACFSRDILPVLVSHCATAGCHDAITHAGGHIYTSYTTTLATVAPGNPGNSHLYISLIGSGEDKMPPQNSPQLTIAQIDSIYKWISYGALDETCGEVCDTINPVTFSGVIWPLLQSTCTGCHSGSAPGGGILIASYANVQTIAANGSLLNSVTGTGVPKMPLGGSLSACRIRQFKIWINNGYPNN